MNALISIIVAPLVGYLADKVSYRNGLLILAWVLNILGTGVTGCSTTREFSFFFFSLPSSVFPLPQADKEKRPDLGQYFCCFWAA